MARNRLSEAEVLAQLPAARARARQAAVEEPHAAAARYDAGTRRLIVSLTNGADFTVPVAQIAELADAPDADVADVEVGPAGLALHWPALDADLSVAGLARVVFGLHVAHPPGPRGGTVAREPRGDRTGPRTSAGRRRA